MRAGIAIGSNLGDRLAQISDAISHLRLLCDPSGPFLVSSIHETLPVRCPPLSPPFLNAVAEIEWLDSPLNLLLALQSLESAAGRPSNRPKNSPRPLDLDILYIDDIQLNLPNLTLPHPLMMSRPFVTIPLGEIRPDLIVKT